jgi:hypothetical protein
VTSIFLNTILYRIDPLLHTIRSRPFGLTCSLRPKTSALAFFGIETLLRREGRDYSGKEPSVRLPPPPTSFLLILPSFPIRPLGVRGCQTGPVGCMLGAIGAHSVVRLYGPSAVLSASCTSWRPAGPKTLVTEQGPLCILVALQHFSTAHRRARTSTTLACSCAIFFEQCPAEAPTV